MSKVKIKITKFVQGSESGQEMHDFNENEIYEVNQDFAENLVNGQYAVFVDAKESAPDKIEDKALDTAPEDKAVKKAPENKAKKKTKS